MSFLVNPYVYAAAGCNAQVTDIFDTGAYTWTSAGSGASKFSVTSGTDPSGFVQCGYGGQTFSGYGNALTTITGRNTKTFEWKFTYERQSGDNADNSVTLLTSYGWADDTPTGTAAFLKFQQSNKTLAFFRAQTATASVTTPQDGTFLQPADNTDRYYTVTGNGTTWKGESWSDSARTADHLSTSDMAFPSDWATTDDLDMFGVGGWSGYWAMGFIVKEVSVCWDNGT